MLLAEEEKLGLHLMTMRKLRNKNQSRSDVIEEGQQALQIAKIIVRAQNLTTKTEKATEKHS